MTKIGIAAVGVSSGGTMVGAARKSLPEATRVANFRREFNDPLSDAEFEKEKRAVQEEFVDSGGQLIHPFPTAVSEMRRQGEDGEEEPIGRVVGVAYKISEEGVPMQHVSTATNPQSVRSAHSATSTQARVLQEKDTVGGSELSDDFSTQSGDWTTPYMSNTASNSNHPYGIAINNYDLYKAERSSQDAYCLRQFYVMRPGTAVWHDSSWICDLGVPIHNWRYGAYDPGMLSQYGPLNVSGSRTVNVSLSTSGASIGWSFDHPNVETTDRCRPEEAYGNWRIGVSRWASAARRNVGL